MKKCVAKFLRIAFEISFFHFGCCNLPFLYFSFWFLPVKTLKKYSEYSEHLFEYSNIIRLFKMGRIRIRIVLFGKKYSNIRIIRIFVSTLICTLPNISVFNKLTFYSKDKVRFDMIWFAIIFNIINMLDI